MNNTIHTIEWQGENGMIRLEAKYQANLQEKINNLDGDICPTGKLEIVERASLTAYFNDKRLDDSWNPVSWKVMEASVPGVYQIRGISKIGIRAEMLEKVQQFLDDAIADGTPVSVRAFRLDHQLKQVKCDLTSHKNTLQKLICRRVFPPVRKHAAV